MLLREVKVYESGTMEDGFAVEGIVTSISMMLREDRTLQSISLWRENNAQSILTEIDVTGLFCNGIPFGLGWLGDSIDTIMKLVSDKVDPSEWDLDGITIEVGIFNDEGSEYDNDFVK